MKVEARVLEVDSTLTGEKVAMGIDDDALAHIMAVLTDLYSDPELAVIREYSTNALDAHIEAGVTRPIEITLPSALAPFLRIRDFGLGLDVEDIRDIYSRYGASTKRSSNEVVGMLGLGCKSALTYTDQFTLSAVKDGVCTQVSISRDEDGSGSMTIVAEYKTDDPTGVEIIIPTKRGNSFQSKARDFFRFWAEGTVLVNGDAPKRIDGLWLADDLLLTTESDRNYVVMGNVAYPMPDNGYNVNGYHAIVAFVNIGDVNFVPSREALQMTKMTKDTLQLIKDRVKQETGPALERIINEAPDKATAIIKFHEVNRLHGNTKLSYRGAVIPECAKAHEITTKVKNWQGQMIDQYDYPHPFIAVEGEKRRYGKGWSIESRIPSNVFRTTIWLTGFDEKSFSPYKRQKLTQWIAEKNISVPQRFVLCDKIPADVIDWIDPATIMDWSEVKAQKIVRENTTLNNGRLSGSYEAIVAGLSVAVKAEDIDTTKPVYWVTKQEYYRPYVALANKANKNGYTIVTLGMNRIAKFKRDFPNALRMIDAVKDLVEKWEAALTDEDKLYLNISNSGHIDQLNKLDAERIEDADLAEVVRISKLAKRSLANSHKEFSSYTTSFDDWKFPVDKYPLLDTLNYNGYNSKKNQDHILLYINAVHAAEQEN